MYLSEHFLNQVGTDFSNDSVRKAIESCEQVLNERLVSVPNSIGKTMYFISKREDDEENGHAREMLDFWDVAKEFAEQYKDYEIIKLAQCIKKLYTNR